MATEHGGCGKGCGGGCCQKGCAVSCGGDDTFGREELLQRLVEYRGMLLDELASIEQAITDMQAANEAGAGESPS